MDPDQLREVAKSGNVDLLKQLLEDKPGILEEVNPIGNTALHLVSMFGDKSIVVEVYGQFSSQVTIQNSFGDTPLHVAARNGSYSVVEYLLEKIISNSGSQDVENGGGPGHGHGLHDILTKQNQWKNTALHEALRYSQPQVANLLIEKDPELCSLVNDARESPLYMAASNGLIDIVRRILQSSQSYAHDGPNGSTALHAAAKGAHLGVIGEFVREKPELVKMKDENGRTPLHHAVTHWSRSSCILSPLDDWAVGLLLGPDRAIGYIQDKDGQTPLHIAAGGINLELIKALIKCCPDSAYQFDGKGQSILHIVMRGCPDANSSSKIFRYLRKKVEIVGLLNQPDQDGNTLFHLAAISQDKRFFKILNMDRRVDKFVHNKKKMTARDIWFDQQRIENKKNIIKLKKGDRQRNNMNNSQEDYEEVENECLTLSEEDSQRRELSQTHIIVATLIATVTFAAAFQMPGGYESGDKEHGMAALAKANAFKAFVVSDSIALSSSMLVVFLHFDEALRKSFGGSVPDYHKITTYLMFISINGMMMAFMTGVYTVLRATESFWVGIITIVVSVLPIAAATATTLGYTLGFVHRQVNVIMILFLIIIALPIFNLKHTQQVPFLGKDI